MPAYLGRPDKTAYRLSATGPVSTPNDIPGSCLLLQSSSGPVRLFRNTLGVVSMLRRCRAVEKRDHILYKVCASMRIRIHCLQTPHDMHPKRPYCYRSKVSMIVCKIHLYSVVHRRSRAENDLPSCSGVQSASSPGAPEPTCSPCEPASSPVAHKLSCPACGCFPSSRTIISVP